jgi:mxaJ protein
MRQRRVTGRAAAGAAAVFLFCAPDARRVPEAAEKPGLRVCADPNNLPFSNRAEEGFENRLARLLGADLGATLRYTWWPQRRGFVRETLAAGRCDVIMGVPTTYARVLATRPYYRSTYVFVSRRDRAVSVRSLDDAALRRLRIGVQLVGDDYANTPPAHALGRRGIVDNVRGFSLYGDYSRPDPPAELIRAVARGDVDVAMAWGPLAGYFSLRQPVALRLMPVSPALDPPALPFAYDISMGVRPGDGARKDVLDRFLAARRVDIDALLAAFGVPRVDGAGGERP